MLGYLYRLRRYVYKERSECTGMKPVLKKERYDVIIWLLMIAALFLAALAVYFIWRALAEPQVNGTLVMAEDILGKQCIT